MKVLGNDEQKIFGLFGPEENWEITTASAQNVEKIECYIEDGDTPWFAIYKKGKIVQRINSRYVEAVAYE